MIPKNQNEREILARLQKLEGATFDATYEENYTAREQSKRIIDELRANIITWLAGRP